MDTKQLREARKSICFATDSLIDATNEGRDLNNTEIDDIGDALYDALSVIESLLLEAK